MKNIKNTNEIPGTYIVARKVGNHVEAFCGFENGVAHIGKADDALVFEYGSMAKMVAEEACGLFSDGWDSHFQYEDKIGNIVGCYIDRHFIEKTDEKYQEHLLQEATSWEAWMREKERGDEACILM